VRQVVGGRGEVGSRREKVSSRERGGRTEQITEGARMEVEGEGRGTDYSGRHDFV
jgi:hypothetical protein